MCVRAFVLQQHYRRVFGVFMYHRVAFIAIEITITYRALTGPKVNILLSARGEFAKESMGARSFQDKELALGMLCAKISHGRTVFLRIRLLFYY